MLPKRRDLVFAHLAEKKSASADDMANVWQTIMMLMLLGCNAERGPGGSSYDNLMKLYSGAADSLRTGVEPPRRAESADSNIVVRGSNNAREAPGPRRVDGTDRINAFL